MVYKHRDTLNINYKQTEHVGDDFPFQNLFYDPKYTKYKNFKTKRLLLYCRFIFITLLNIEII